MNEVFKVLREILGANMYLRPLTWRQFRRTLARKKENTSIENSQLAKVLSTLDLTALGIGSTLGVGVYVLAGEVSKNYAGPAVVISFLIAAIASLFAGLCYAEFGSRVPKAGSAYIYSYVSVGEFIAFIIGWNLILEYVIGSASVVKGLFIYLDALCSKSMSTWFHDLMPINVANMGTYPDFFSLIVTILFSVALAFGARESSLVNNVFTVVNLAVVLFVIISAMWKVDPKNWALSEQDVQQGANTSEFGVGGFAPFGISGIIKGAARCFYGFIGFDCIATAGEEAKTPKKSIPIAIVTSLLVIFLAYFGISTALTMMLPYYLQDEEAPFPHVYDTIGWTFARYIVTAGALCGLFSSLLGAMFPLPRIIYAMATDGLLFRFMGKVHPKFQTPFMGTMLAGLFTGCLACIFELKQLFTMMSIGTLLAYSMVAACVLILRYDDDSSSDKKDEDNLPITCMNLMGQMYNTKLRQPTTLSAKLVTLEVAAYVVACFGLAILLSQFEDELAEANVALICGIVIFACLAVIILLSINCQPISQVELTFAVPYVPWLPALSMMINIYLMTMLDYMTWIRFAVWIAIGLLIYFSYGMWNSNEIEGTKAKKHDKNDNIPDKY